MTEKGDRVRKGRGVTVLHRVDRMLAFVGKNKRQHCLRVGCRRKERIMAQTVDGDFLRGQVAP